MRGGGGGNRRDFRHGGDRRFRHLRNFRNFGGRRFIIGSGGGWGWGWPGWNSNYYQLLAYLSALQTRAATATPDELEQIRMAIQNLGQQVAVLQSLLLGAQGGAAVQQPGFAAVQQPGFAAPMPGYGGFGG